ncbi:ubiquinone biosynthesis accessory factor UbiJ [Marinobacterium rhizophilum]|uniref:Ubiquinone biosynthesis accessory factor UbiJ n=1 Tax=Marinobacterium rhizophilum TaxID=420402 RepID=A0ABY5HHN6_9GAMM|nr:SCP2 sterol-binding domain-containing protein [Marinobacterium rhizophilum]UTW10491.1 SCP2 sterol-binding domain-containing protein [Marinobacterium rhizophilum]
MALDMLNATLVTLVEQGLNSLLSRDPVTLRALGRLGGRVIALQISSPVAMTLYLIPNNEGLQLQQHYGAQADAVIAGSASALLRLVSSDDKAAALFGKGVTISGDSALANRLQAILADTDIDWEGLLADQIGDLPAYQAARFLRQQGSYWRQSGRSLSHNLGEYLQEEARLLPPRAELEGFMADVDRLRQRSDRLEARLQRILHRLDPND